MNKNLDVCLIYLPKKFLKNPDAQAPAGLLYLAASLEQKGRTVVLENFASLSDEQAIEKLPPATLYGITVTSLEVLQANRFSKLIKIKYPGAKIIIGGPGAYSEEFVDYNYIDSVFFGDGEISIHEVLQDAEQGPLKKKYIGQTVENLDSLPFPSRHLLKDKQGGDIFAYGKHYADGDSTIVLSSRGCAYQCAFCSAPALTHNNCLRFRSPENVAEEIKYVRDIYGIKQIRFSDDMFTANEKRTLAMCEAIGPLNVFWRISCRVKPLTEKMLKAMKNAGCVELSFGIESFDDMVLTGLKKRSTAWDNANALEMAMKHGFSTRILMMIRTPFQTPNTIKLNKHFLSKVPYSIIACTGFIPIPGCNVWKEPDKYNIEILDKDLDKYNFYMYNDKGRRPLDKIFNIKGRNIDEFHAESEEFRDWLEENGKVNKG